MVVHTVQNRVYRRGLNVKDVIHEPYQFSWTLDPEKLKMPITEFKQGEYLQCRRTVEKALALYLDGNISKGVDHYFNFHLVQPAWMHSMTFIKKIGNHAFYRS